MALEPSRESVPCSPLLCQCDREQLVHQSWIKTVAVAGCLSCSIFVVGTTASQASDTTTPSTNAEIRKRSDASAESDRRAAQNHFEKLRGQSNTEGLSNIKPAPPYAESTTETNASSAQATTKEPQKVSPQSSYVEVLHEGPCTPCELSWQGPIDSTTESSPESSTRSHSATPKSVPKPTPKAGPNDAGEKDYESTTKPSLPSKRSAVPTEKTTQSHFDRGPLQVGNLRGLVPQTVKDVGLISSQPILVAKVTLLPPPKISAIPDTKVKTNTSTPQVVSSSSPQIRRYTSVSKQEVSKQETEPLRVGSLGANASEFKSYSSYFVTQEPALLDKEAMVSPSLTDSSSPSDVRRELSNSVVDSNVQQAAFQGPVGGGFGLPPTMGNSANVQPSIQSPVVTAPVYPTEQTYQTPPVNNSVYPAPQGYPGGSVPSTSPSFSPQPGYGLPNYQNRGNTIASGEPFVTAAPRQFDACYMVEPTYANTNGCGSPPMANTPPYSGLPGSFAPPTMMPNQVPPGLYSNNSAGFRPLFGFGQDANNVQLGRGLWGQPKAYVPGQCFRNSLRYITP